MADVAPSLDSTYKCTRGVIGLFQSNLNLSTEVLYVCISRRLSLNVFVDSFLVR